MALRHFIGTLGTVGIVCLVAAQPSCRQEQQKRNPQVTPTKTTTLSQNNANNQNNTNTSNNTTQIPTTTNPTPCDLSDPKIKAACLKLPAPDNAQCAGTTLPQEICAKVQAILSASSTTSTNNNNTTNNTKTNNNTTNNTKTSDTTAGNTTTTGGKTCTVTTKDGPLNLRASASTTATKLVEIPKGTQVPYIESKSGWVKTKYEGNEGWACDTCNGGNFLNCEGMMLWEEDSPEGVQNPDGSYG
jgi:hypothetical protein